MKYLIFTSHTEGINVDKGGDAVIYTWIFVKDMRGICLHMVLFVIST